jgi:hypothetical protein
VTVTTTRVCYGIVTVTCENTVTVTVTGDSQFLGLSSCDNTKIWYISSINATSKHTRRILVES